MTINEQIESLRADVYSVGKFTEDEKIKKCLLIRDLLIEIGELEPRKHEYTRRDKKCHHRKRQANLTT
jgi:hypothetical protein